MCAHPHPSFLPDLILPDVARTFIHPHDEELALRRAAVLLERVRQDGGLRDAGFLELQAVVDAMRRAAADSRAIHHSAIERLASVLTRVSASGDPRKRDEYESLRSTALFETRDLVGRLARLREAPQDVKSGRPAFSARASED